MDSSGTVDRAAERAPGSLPATLVLEAAFVAERPQRLPPMPTTALHGALGHALLHIGCVLRRPCCDDCHHTSGCSWWVLMRPEPPPSAGEGVVDRAPPPLILTPIDMALGKPHLALQAGEKVRFRICIVGERAICEEALVRAALNRVAQYGLGIANTGDRGLRPRLQLDSVVRIPDKTAGAESRARLTFLSPARLTRDGRVTPSLDAELLWKTMLRRADTLARCHGSGPLADAPTRLPFELEDVSVSVVRVRRHSSRQDSPMVWPGIVGSATLQGPELQNVWPLLRFAERVQIGKGTSFGFGRIELTTDPIHGHQ